MTDLTPADVLTRAAEVIERNGWQRGDFYDSKQARDGIPVEKCRVCVLGAISLVTEGAPVPMRHMAGVEYEAIKALRRRLGMKPDYWNDHTPNLTSQDVVDTLRQVAAKLRERQ